ncbi:MAG: hypothetical protein AMXMBFR58_04760 [Phycisphaerae bacterium]
MNNAENGRLTYEDSCRVLMDAGLLETDEIPPMPARMPRHDDPEPLGVSFFRTELAGQHFVPGLSLPRTFFGRSTITQCEFLDFDLTESSLCWCDIDHVRFDRSVLRGCDLRASTFRYVSFRSADLTKADLRHSTFRKCDFRHARLAGAVLHRSWRWMFTLSAKQRAEVEWHPSGGEDPPGG